MIGSCSERPKASTGRDLMRTLASTVCSRVSLGRVASFSKALAVRAGPPRITALQSIATSIRPCEVRSCPRAAREPIDPLPQRTETRCSMPSDWEEPCRRPSKLYGPEKESWSANFNSDTGTIGFQRMDFPNLLWLRELRWKQGREGFAQYALACLFLGGPPLGWNRPRRLSMEGKRLLSLLDEKYAQNSGTDPDFFWEFKLGKFPEDRENGWPDLALIWDDRVLIFELKTEAGSHRVGQIDWYMRLAVDRFSDRAIDLVYLTVDPIEAAPKEIPKGVSYHNRLWTEVAEAIDASWQEDSDPMSSNARVFAGYLRDMSASTRRPEIRPPEEKAQVRPTERALLEELPKGLLERCRLLAAEVVSTGEQRALDWVLKSLEEAKELRRGISSHLTMEPEDSPLHAVTLWVWTSASSGAALSSGGRKYNVELRISKKGRP